MPIIWISTVTSRTISLATIPLGGSPRLRPSWIGSTRRSSSFRQTYMEEHWWQIIPTIAIMPVSTISVMSQTCEICFGLVKSCMCYACQTCENLATQIISNTISTYPAGGVKSCDIIVSSSPCNRNVDIYIYWLHPDVSPSVDPSVDFLKNYWLSWFHTWTLMGWVSWPLHIFVFLPSILALWWPNIWPKMGFSELKTNKQKKLFNSIH